MARRSGWIAVAFVAALVLSVGTASGGRGNGSKLSKEDRATIARDRVKGEDSVTLLLDAQPGDAAALASSVQALGGTVRYSDDDLGYARVDVSPQHADDVASLPGVQGVGLDQVIPLASLPDSTTPAVNPYLPTGDIGAPQFVADHPTFDGRGTTIGILDTGVDPTRPELQTAYDRKGKAVPKVVDWVASTDPETDGDGSWVKLDDVTAKGKDATFSVDGATYTAPKSGRYGFGIFREDALCPDASAGSCEMHDDVNRDGDTSDAFGVLVARGGHNSRVWVDTNQDGSFADQKEMREYRVRRDVDFFGTAADETKRVPFVVDVERDGRDRYVDIGIVSGGHGTHVAGIAAGNGFFGGEMDGVAPGAQIVSARACRWPSGCPAHALIEGMIFLAKDAKVDVINLSVGSLPLLNDGNTPRCDLYNRLVERTGAQIVVAAGNNGPGGGTVNDPATCDDVVSVGAYLSSATWAADLGVSGVQDQVSIFSSRGPREDGGLAPLLVAPGAAVSTWPAWDTAAQVKPGYGFVQGTSQAAPEATGALALLLSAARQSKVDADPEALRRALASGASWLDGYGPDAQGNGLLQVGDSWNVLSQSGRRVPEIASSARVSTVLSSFLETPGQGPGLYVREGWDAGEGGSETISFTRLDGRSDPIAYQVSWKGDPAFSSAGSITLARGVATPLTVDVAPLSQGVHSAIVSLDDPATPGIDYQTMATIDASSPFGADWSLSGSDTILRADARPAVVVQVPEGAHALVATALGASGVRVRPRTFTPAGVEVGPFNGPAWAVPDPQPGTWEIDVEGNRASAPSGAYLVRADLFGVDAESAPTADGVELTFANRFHAFTGGAVGGPLESVATASPTIADGETQEYTVDVPAGATSLRASIGDASEPSADLDLLLFDCTSGTCVQAAKSAGGTAEESVSVASPAAGRWKISVVGAFVPTGTTGYAYTDAYASPALGSVTVSDPRAAHATGSSWTVDATVSATGTAGAGRTLRGVVTVTADGLVVGPLGGPVTVGRAEIDLP